MSDYQQHSSNSESTARNATEKMTRAVNAAATDNQNINHNHNTKKQSLGPNTKR